MKIGILTRSFISLIGAFDFIYQIILGLHSVRKKHNLELYIFIEEDRIADRHKKGIVVNHAYNEKNALDYFLFLSLPDIKLVFYKHKDLAQISQEMALDCILPHTDFNLFKEKISSIGYLYDCQHKYLPEFFTANEIKTRDLHFTSMLEGPVIVNARDVKNDLIKFYNAKPENIFALPVSPKLNVNYLESYSNDTLKYNLSSRYFLSSNQFWKHKNHATLFKAFAKFIENTGNKDINLYCTGTMKDYRRPEYISELEELIQSLEIENRVHLLGLIPKTDQIEIMKNAIALIQTTLFEGGPGGGAVWDACSLGVPSIVSDIRVNKELESELVTFFEAKNFKDLAEKMEEALIKSYPKYSSDELKQKSLENMERLGNYLVSAIQKNKYLKHENNSTKPVNLVVKTISTPYAPIVLFVYNRPEHTKKVIEALQKNILAQESELFIFSDGAKGASEDKVKEVREYIRTIKGFKNVTIFESPKNKGLANSLIAGITDIVNRYGKIIVLEDDIVTSPYFLQFMNDSLITYENEEKVGTITGYVYPADYTPPPRKLLYATRFFMGLGNMEKDLGPI